MSCCMLAHIFCLYSRSLSPEVWPPIPYMVFKRNPCSPAVRTLTMGTQCHSKSDSSATTCLKPFELAPQSVNNLTLRTPPRSFPTGSAVVSMTLLHKQPHPLTPEILVQKLPHRGSLQAARPASPLTFLEDTFIPNKEHNSVLVRNTENNMD